MVANYLVGKQPLIDKVQDCGQPEPVTEKRQDRKPAEMLNTQQVKVGMSRVYKNKYIWNFNLLKFLSQAQWSPQ
eukprot:Gb_20298 [translate_table: standard]